jgi:putative phosphoesterase
MRIAILSDIHGNLIALNKVLNFIDKNKINTIIILGDIITDFPENTNKILDKIKKYTSYIIKGNREEYIINIDQKLNNYKQLLPVSETYKIITEENYNFIKSLPEQIVIHYSNVFSLRCVHGSPNSITEILYENNDDMNKKILKNIDQNILLCEHNHKQWIYEYNNKYIISVGSVGINFNGNHSAQFVVLDYGDKINIELMEIKYDLNLLKMGKEDKNDWVNIYIKGIETGKDLNKEFLEELKLKTKKWPVSNKIWDKQYKEWQRNGKI